MAKNLVLDIHVYFTIHAIVLCVSATGCQNANLTAVPAKVALGDSILLSCEYNGTGNISAVSWFNGSNYDALMLTPGSIAPKCDVFLAINTSYDPTRISYTCDTTRNVFTLNISPIVTVDENVTWSCTFQDPLPCPNMARYTIMLTGKQPPQPPQRDGFSLTWLVITATAVLIISIIIIVIYLSRKGHYKLVLRPRE